LSNLHIDKETIMKRITLLIMAGLIALASGCAVYAPGPPGVGIAYYDDGPHHHHHDHRW
jgi:hypothetical protein